MADTSIFIAWSGSLSRSIATTLRDWLPDVIRDAKPWVSSEDLRKGLAWVLELAKNLATSKLGIVVLTRENLLNPWVHFESGAISQALSDKHCCPLLCDVKPTDVSGPLAQFQATTLTEKDMFRLVKTINATSEQASDETRLKRWFDQFWPSLMSKVEAAGRGGESEDKHEPTQTDRELLEEVLSMVRRSARSQHEFLIRRRSESHHLPSRLGDLERCLSELPEAEQAEIMHLIERRFVRSPDATSGTLRRRRWSRVRDDSAADESGEEGATPNSDD